MIYQPKFTEDKDDIRQLSDKDTRFIKLYEPLSDELEKGDLVNFVEEKLEPYQDR